VHDRVWPRLLLTHEKGRSFPSATNVGGYTQSLPTPRLIQVRRCSLKEGSKKFESQKIWHMNALPWPTHRDAVADHEDVSTAFREWCRCLAVRCRTGRARSHEQVEGHERVHGDRWCSAVQFSPQKSFIYRFFMEHFTSCTHILLLHHTHSPHPHASGTCSPWLLRRQPSRRPRSQRRSR
jgi:hypothetical protein